MKMKFGLSLLLLWLLPLGLFAQTSRITGRVTDALDGSPIVGAVVHTQNNVATSTNSEGVYEIMAKSGDVLTFTLLGKETATVTVAKRQIINVQMNDHFSDLDDIIVIGYGSVRKKDLTGAVGQIKGDKLLQGNPSLSINSALQGKMAGVQVQQTDGTPGGGINIQIRGTNSFSTNTQPLYVVDGIPYSGGDGAASTGISGSGSGSNPMANINPNDIESIEILKDASATAIYGSRGANGVVLITTKRGTDGKNNIRFSFNLSISQISKKLDVLGPVDYANYRNEQMTRAESIYDLPFRGEWYYDLDNNSNIITSSGKYAPAPGDFLKPGIYTDEYGNKDIVGSTDWQDAIFQTGVTQEYNLSLDGASEKGSYLISLNYTDQEGTIIGSGYSRFAVRSNATRKMRKWLDVGLNINYTNAKTNFINSSTSGGDGVIYSALSFPPTYDPTINTQEDNELNWMAANPYVYVREAFDENRANNVYISSFFEIKILPGLKFKQNIGYSYSGNDHVMYYNRLTRQGYDPINGKGAQGTSWSQGITSESLLSYDKTFGTDHTLSALLGVTFEESNWKSNNMVAWGFPSDMTKMWDMSAALNHDTPGSSRGTNRMQSNLARLNYSYKGKYMATLSFRADGSSVFVEGNKYAPFFSAALAWRISDEKLINDLNIFSDLKLRASYGQTGNQGISTYATVPALSVSNYPFGGSLVAGFVEQFWKGPMNKNLKWETTTQYDIGLDMSFLRGRINLVFDYYNKRTSDLLQRVLIETNSGYNSMATNSGWVKNSGLEISGNFIPIIRKSFRWTIDANISFNKNTIGGLDGDQYAGNLAGQVSHVFVQRNGCPIGTVVGFVEDGYYDNLAEVRADPRYATVTETEAKAMIGEIKFRDFNKDGQITDADKRVIGDTNPKFMYGLTNTFRYKNFDLSIFIQGTYGNDMVNANTIANNTGAPMTGIMNITTEQYRTRWTEENTAGARWPRAISEGYTRLWRFSDRYVENGSYLRLKNINLGYTFFPSWKGISSINIYIAASNLFTITNYSWYDPDVSAYGGDVSRRGVDMFSYPSSRTFSAGLKFDF